MSNIPDYILAGLVRLNDFMAAPAVAKCLPNSIKGKIPFGISCAYDFFETEIFNTRFLLIGKEQNESDISPTVLAKHRDIVQKQTGLIPIFIFKKAASYLFTRYAKKNINMIVAGKHLFLPALFLIAHKEKACESTSETRPPIAFQIMALYHLEKEKLDGKTMREVAQLLHLSYATVNRSVRWMSRNGFISLAGGKEKRIQFALHGKELWNKALPFFVNPVDLTVTAPAPLIAAETLVSGQNALAEYTMLNGGSERVAVSKSTVKSFKEQNVFSNGYGETEVEVWKYNPRLLSETGVVDKLSLYLTLKDHADERVQIELENMIKEIVW